MHTLAFRRRGLAIFTALFALAGCAGSSVGPMEYTGLQSAQNVIPGGRDARHVVPDAQTLVTVQWSVSRFNPQCSRTVVVGADVYLTTDPAREVRLKPVNGQKAKTGPLGKASLWGYPSNVTLYLHAEKEIKPNVWHFAIHEYGPGRVPLEPTLCPPKP